jgi:hypothetical protein
MLCRVVTLLIPLHPFAPFRDQRTFLDPIDPAEIDAAGPAGDCRSIWDEHLAFMETSHSSIQFTSHSLRSCSAPAGPLLASLKSVAAVLRFRSGGQRLIWRDGGR